MVEPGKYCDCHYKHTAQITDVKSDHEKIWDALRDRVGTRFFTTLVIITVTIFLSLGTGMVGFNFMIYDSLKKIETRSSLIENNLKHHLDECELLKIIGCDDAI